jgi:hypothetical protein
MSGQVHMDKNISMENRKTLLSTQYHSWYKCPEMTMTLLFAYLPLIATHLERSPSFLPACSRDCLPRAFALLTLAYTTLFVRTLPESSDHLSPSFFTILL